MVVRGVSQISSPESIAPSTELAPHATEQLEAAPQTFESVLGGLLVQASDQHHAATNQAEAVARGSLDDLHGTMIAVKEAEISLKLVGSIRNRLIEAFQEIWRTNV